MYVSVLTLQFVYEWDVKHNTALVVETYISLDEYLHDLEKLSSFSVCLFSVTNHNNVGQA